MAVDYDLVVIGSSWEGLYAARNAVQLQARVALVTHSDDKYLPNDVLVNQSLSAVGKFNYQLANNPFVPALVDKQSAISLGEAGNWIQDVDSVVQSSNSLSNLAALGVDVIIGRGEFYSQPKLGLQVGQRKLRSRDFLLATGTIFAPRFSERNSLNTCLTLRDLKGKNLSALPQEIVIIGSEPIALELAQTLARFDKIVTLIVELPRILPQEDLDIAILIQAQLEAEGIKIFTGLQVSQIKEIEGQKWIQVGDRALVVDEIIIVNNRQPNINGLNLAGVDVKYNKLRVNVNEKLQTTNPNIYACGDLIGGYCMPNIAQYEVNLILKNTLFVPWYKANYNYLPWAFLTEPNLARVGLNETQAKQKYGDNLYVIQQYFTSITQAQILEQTSGLCKLIVQENGEILGCSLVGDRASELITIVALMMQHKIKLERNPMKGLTSLSIPTIYPSMAEILQQASDSFDWQKLQRDPKLLNRLKTWFSIRKNH